NSAPGCTAKSLKFGLAEFSGLEAEDIALFVDQLFNLGLLERQVPVPDQQSEPLRGLAEFLANVERDDELPPALCVLQNELHQASRHRCEYSKPRDADERLRQRRSVDRLLRRAACQISRRYPVDSFAAGMTFRDTAVYQDVAARLSYAGWKP